MKKKTRDLKKHYRNVEKELRDFDIDLSEDSWYRMWHIHLDWDGITSISNKQRKIHIIYYLKIFEKIDLQSKGSKRSFKRGYTWMGMTELMTQFTFIQKILKIIFLIG